jgi:serine/threonine-protein kinase
VPSGPHFGARDRRHFYAHAPTHGTPRGAEFAAHPQRLVRFRREAQVLASLNHPSLAAIYGLEEDRALILELVQGDNPSGPMPVETVLALARQLAEALDYAHERGIVHLDWKPVNIKVTPEDRIKVLDFGFGRCFGILRPIPQPRRQPAPNPSYVR